MSQVNLSVDLQTFLSGTLTVLMGHIFKGV